MGFSSQRVFLADASLRNTRVVWLDGRNLEIICPDCEKYGVDKQVDAWREVKVKVIVGKGGSGS